MATKLTGPPNKRLQQTGGAMAGRGAPPAAEARRSADDAYVRGLHGPAGLERR